MKSLDYHHPNDTSSYRSFFIGLQIFSIFFAVVFFIQEKHLAFAVAGVFLILSQFCYWLYRSAFISFATTWIKLSTRLSHFMTPLILCLFYYLILTPYGLIFRIIEKRNNTSWHESENELRFKDPF